MVDPDETDVDFTTLVLRTRPFRLAVSGTRPAGLAILPLCLLASRTALAADPSPHFEVQRLAGAEDCPDAPTLTSAVAQALAADPPETPPDRIQAAAFDVEFSRDGERYVAKVHHSALGVERTLVSDGPGCGSLASAVGVAVTFLLDTMNRAATPEPEPAPPPTPAPTPTPAPAPTPTLPPRPRPATNSLFIEFLGSAITYSLDVEHLFNRYVGARIGFGATYDNGPRAGAGSQPPGPIVGTLAPAVPFGTGLNTLTTLPAGEGPANSLQLLFPLLATFAIPLEGAEHVHLGAGATVTYRTSPAPDGWYAPVNALYGGGVQDAGANVLGNFTVGYRHLPRREHEILFGIDFILLYSLHGVVPWAGASTGLTF
jgi:hypothetical protein